MTRNRSTIGSPINWRAALDHVGEWTEEDYDALPEGLRAELHDGKLILTPAPTADHQIALNALFLAFYTVLRDKTRIIGGTDIRLANGARRRIPDLMVVREQYHGSPTSPDNVLVVVEIVSPRDGEEWTQKMIDYAEGGIPGYLIVRGGRGGFSAWYHVLRDGAYTLASHVGPGGTLTMAEPFECDIDLDELGY